MSQSPDQSIDEEISFRPIQAPDTWETPPQDPQQGGRDSLDDSFLIPPSNVDTDLVNLLSLRQAAGSQDTSPSPSFLRTPSAQEGSQERHLPTPRTSTPIRRQVRFNLTPSFISQPLFDQEEVSPVRMAQAKATREMVERINLLMTKYPYDPVEDDDKLLPAGPFDTNLDAETAEEYLDVLKRRAKKARDLATFKDMAEALGKHLTPTDRGEKIPKFSGKSTEVAKGHLLSVEDWQKRKDYSDTDMARHHFIKTLEGEARVWYKDLQEQNANWAQVKKEFIREYEKHGKHNRQLKSEIAKIQFNEKTDDIGKFLREVRSTCEMLEMDNEAICTTIKEAMPQQVYWTIHQINDLGVLTRTLADFFPKKEGRTAASNPAPTHNPFMIIQADGQNDQKDDSKAKPFKPRIHPGGRGRPKTRPNPSQDEGTSQQSSGNDDPLREAVSKLVKELAEQNKRGASYRLRGDVDLEMADYVNDYINKRPRQQYQPPARRDYPRGKDGKYVKRTGYVNPNPNAGRGKARNPRTDEVQKTTDRNRCMRCMEIGHWAKDCPHPYRMDSMYHGYFGPHAYPPYPPQNMYSSYVPHHPPPPPPQPPVTVQAQLAPGQPSNNPSDRYNATSVYIPATGRTVTYTGNGYKVTQDPPSQPPPEPKHTFRLLSDDGVVEVDTQEN